MVILNPSTWDAEEEDVGEFEATLLYKVSSYYLWLHSVALSE